MRPSTTIDEVQTALARLVGETSFPTNEQTLVADYITAAVQRLYRLFNFEMSKQELADSTDSSGILNLADLKLGIIPAIEVVTTGEEGGQYGFVTRANFDDFSQGDNKYTLVVNEDGELELHTTEPSTAIIVVYFEAPDISTTQAVCFTKDTVAKGAVMDYRLAMVSLVKQTACV